MAELQQKVRQRGSGQELMEVAVHCAPEPGARWRDFLKNPALDRALPWLNRAPGSEAAFERTKAFVDEVAGSTTVTRVYIGNEFCPLAVPGVAAVERMAREAVDAGLEVSLVLGPLSESRQSFFLSLVGQCERACPGRLEVVGNDWGTMAALSGHGVVPVAGRMLFRMKRLPRLSADTLPDVPSGVSTDELKQRQLASLAEFPGTSSWFREFAGRLGFCRMDTELLPQGIRFVREPDVALSLHVPYTYVTGGATCPHLATGERTVKGRQQCSLECRTSYTEAHYPYKTRPLFEVGGTVFMNSVRLLAGYSTHPYYDRIIVER